jgi:hypothetical protein
MEQKSAQDVDHSHLELLILALLARLGLDAVSVCQADDGVKLGARCLLLLHRTVNTPKQAFSLAWERRGPESERFPGEKRVSELRLWREKETWPRHDSDGEERIYSRLRRT